MNTSTDTLRAALEAAKNGLIWYREQHPEDDSGADDEMMAEIEAALATQATNNAAPADEMSPDFTDTARAALAWVLWHHQGASSGIGQAVRFALGIGSQDRMSEHQVAEAKRWRMLPNRGVQTLASVPLPKCLTCGDQGMIGGHSGQTAESYEEHAEPCPDCNAPDDAPLETGEGDAR